MATKSLAALVQSLPQELYDEIYDLTFTADDEPRVIYKDYTPPHLLHVDSASRAKYARSYYGSSTFKLPLVFGEKWVRSVQASHFDMICEFAVSRDGYKPKRWRPTIYCWSNIIAELGYYIAHADSEWTAESKGITVRNKEGKLACWKVEAEPHSVMGLTKICEAA